MATLLGLDKKVNLKLMQLAYGYARRQTKDIPQPIIDLILLFYCQFDEWDPDVVEGNVVIINKKRVKVRRSKLSPRGGSAFLKNIISDGVFAWKFKIINVCVGMEFGVMKISKINRSCGQLFDRTNGHSWEATRYKDKGWLMDPKTYTQTMLREYGPQCKNGDVIEMILDLEQMTMRYKVNGVDLGIAFEEVEKTEYKAAIFMYAYGREETDDGCIELLN